MLLPQKPAAHAHQLSFVQHLNDLSSNLLSVVAKQVPVKLSQLLMLDPVMVYHHKLTGQSLARLRCSWCEGMMPKAFEQEHDLLPCHDLHKT